MLTEIECRCAVRRGGAWFTEATCDGCRTPGALVVHIADDGDGGVYCQTCLMLSRFYPAQSPTWHLLLRAFVAAREYFQERDRRMTAWIERAPVSRAPDERGYAHG